MTETPASYDLMAHYRAQVNSGDLHHDPEQNFVVEKLAILARRLNARPQEKKRGFASAIFGWGREPVAHEPLKGLYIYGEVGRGKSMLMNLFVDAVGSKAWRVHFHEFMQGVHQELATIRKGKAEEPLQVVADRIAERCEVLCLDEMQVENIADAMIVGRLFAGIFARGVVLVTTSNRHPDDLYKGGLNRHRFVPFLGEIKAHCEIVSLGGDEDFRRKHQSAARYFVEDHAGFEGAWDALGGAEQAAELEIAGRVWRIARSKGDAAYLRFSEACEEARGAQDYHKLAAQFSKVFLADVPTLSRQNTSASKRFVTLIDVLYEAGTVLYLDLQVPLEALHSDEDTAFVFERTLSRLNEMNAPSWG